MRETGNAVFGIIVTVALFVGALLPMSLDLAVAKPLQDPTSDPSAAVEAALHRVLTTRDPRNEGVEVSASVQGSELHFNMQSIDAEKGPMDVFRVFLQFAEELQEVQFDRVYFDFRGESRFMITGEYFAELGREFEEQNPVYTMRTFPSHVQRTDGSSPYPKRRGGLLGVVGEQMKDFRSFHDAWYISNLLPELRAAAAEEAGDDAMKPIDGSWYAMNSTDVMTDEVSTFLIATDDPYSTRGLVFRCDDESAIVALLLGEYMIGDRNDKVVVRYRIDDLEPVGANWSLSNNNEIAFVPSSKRDDLVRDVASSAGRIVIQITDPRDGDSVTMQLDTPRARSILLEYAPCVAQDLEE